MKLFSRFRKHVSADQIHTYRSQGFVLVSGLIPEGILDQARDTLSAHIPSGQRGSLQQVLSDRALLRCVTKQLHRVAEDLESITLQPSSPSSLYTLAVGPEPGPWQWPSPHIDHSKIEDRFESLPPPFRIGCLIYLTDVLSQAGGTVVWPGSHSQLARLLQGDVNKYRLMSSLNAEIPNLELRTPVEITAKAGDSLFYNYLCAHSGSKNTGTIWRLALNHKWY